MTTRRGACPHCGNPVPLIYALTRRGQWFSCANCHNAITVAKSRVWIAILAFALIAIFSRHVPFFALLPLLIAMILAECLLCKVEAADGRATAPHR